MIKNAIKKKVIVYFLTFIILLIIYFIPINKTFNEQIIINNNINYVYLLNKNNKLVRVSSLSMESDTLNKVKEIINYLTINNKSNNYINNKLKPIIPENTKVLDLSLDKNLLKINFSKELLNINDNLKEKLIESIVYSLTEFDEIENIMLFVEEESLINLNGLKLPILLNRNYGINKIYDITNISNTNQYTIYYYTNIDGKYNVMPVTIFTNDNQNKVEVIIKNLKSSSIYQTDLVSFLSNNAKLLDYELLENKIKLNFNNYLLDNFYDEELLEEVKYALSNSFKDSLNIKEIEILINGKKI